MEYENIIFELELLGGAEDLCARNICFRCKAALVAACAADPERLCYLQAAACLREVEDANRAKLPATSCRSRGIAAVSCPAPCTGPAAACRETADTQRLKTLLQWLSAHYTEELRVADAAGSALQCQPLHAVVPADDRAELCGLSERVPAQRRAEALQATDETVLTIASRCGFENLSYFNRRSRRTSA